MASKKYNFTPEMDDRIRNFIKESVAVIDMRKVDKYWIVDLLSGGDY